MNCKPGDLAIIIYSPIIPKYLGRIVRITKSAGVIEHKGVIYQCWHTIPKLKGLRGKTIVPEDVCLRPIRDQDGEDEILRIAGKPHEVAA